MMRMRLLVNLRHFHCFSDYKMFLALLKKRQTVSFCSHQTCVNVYCKASSNCVISSMPLKNNFYRRKLPDLCTSFASEKGKQLFKNALNSGHMESYFSLGAQLRTQDEPAYCGLTSLVMVLNALAVDPGFVWKGVWRWYHEDMLECCKSLDDVKTDGVSLEQLSCIAKCNQLESQLYHTTEKDDIQVFRNLVKKVSQSNKVAIVACFGRSVLKQTGTGHFAPIGGYSPEDDHVLMLEPARFKYPPFWVPLSLLWKAMCTVVEDTGQYRGYLVLSKSDNQPTLLFKISKTFHLLSPTREESLSMFKHIIEFLQSEPDENHSVEEDMKKICQTIFRISTEDYKQKRKGLFFNSLSDTKFGELSPEHQEAVRALVAEIESMRLYELVRSALDAINCCQTLFVVTDDTKECCRSCVLCLPHYMTIFLLVLPIFARERSEKGGTGTEDGVERSGMDGTYFQVVLKLSQPSDKDGDETLGKVLLSNEVKELQKQVVSVLDGQPQNSCCGEI